MAVGAEIDGVVELAVEAALLDFGAEELAFLAVGAFVGALRTKRIINIHYLYTGVEINSLN